MPHLPPTAGRTTGGHTKSASGAPERLFVGRRAELSRLDAALKAAGRGEPSIAVLGGEPGIGKTRTVDEFSRLARDQGWSVASGRCLEGAGAPSYWPWIQVLRGFVPAHPEPVAAEVELAELIGALSGHAARGDDTPRSDPSGERFFMFDRITELVVSMADVVPRLLVLDDLHCADEPSLLLFRFFATQVTRGRILIVATFRDSEVSRNHPLTAVLAELARHPSFTRILLGGLNEDDVARLVAAVAGGTPGDGVVSWLHQETGGNPLFVSETIRLLAAEGRLAEGGGVWSQGVVVPQGVRDVIGARLGRLSPETNQLLSFASVVGREFNVAVLDRIASLPHDRVVDMLDEACAARLVAQVPNSHGRYAFSHSLVREALYRELTTARRIKLHREVGEALEGLGVEDTERLFQVAHHFFEASSGGVAEKALRWVLAAADRATRLLAYEEASVLYKRAIEIVDLAGDASLARRCELLLALGESQMRSGESPKASESFVKAADVARAAGLAELLARAAIGLGTRFDLFAADVRLIELLEEALAVLPRPSALKARVMGRLASALLGAGRLDDRTRRLATNAVEMARGCDDRVVLGYIISAQFLVLWGPDTVHERAALADELKALAVETGDPRIGVEGDFFRMVTMLELGRYADADAENEAFHRDAKAFRHPMYLRSVAMLDAHRAILEGRFDDAEEHARRAGQIGQRSQDHSTRQIIALLTCLARRERGAIDGGLVREVEDLADQYPIAAFRSLVATLYAELGDADHARRTFDQLALADFRHLRRDVFFLSTLAFLSDVAWDLGDAGRAAPVYDLLAPYDDQDVLIGAATAYLGSVSHYLALLATLMQRWEIAETQVAKAIARHRERGARPLLARSEWLCGTMLLRRGHEADRVRASEHLARARERARDLGMVGLLRRLDALGEDGSARRLGTRARADGDVESPARSAFRREGEYWTLSNGDAVYRLRDAAGMRYLAALLRAPGQEFLSLHLVEGARHGSARGEGGFRLDSRARSEYRRRIQALDEELREADQRNDIGLAARRRAERDTLLAELARASGLGGRDRGTVSDAERARVNVTRAIKTAIRAITRLDGALGRHLANSIRTGTFCSYSPDPSSTIRWSL
jgi:hypothetical protein